MSPYSSRGYLPSQTETYARGREPDKMSIDKMLSILALALAAAMLLLRSDAFTPVPRVSSKKLFTLSASNNPLTELCEITKEACMAVAQMLNGKTIIYNITRSHFPIPYYLSSEHSHRFLRFIQSYTLRLRLVLVPLTLQHSKVTQRSSPLQTVLCSICSSSTSSLVISLEIL